MDICALKLLLKLRSLNSCLGLASHAVFEVQLNSYDAKRCFSFWSEKVLVLNLVLTNRACY